MRIRHRTPQIFSLSMMDVFCCTLGCVLLLWLVSQRELSKKSRDARSATDELTAARAERDAVTAEMAAAKAKADDATRRMAEAERVATDSADRLSKLTAADRQKADELATARARLDELDTLTRAREERLAALTRRENELTRELNQQRSVNADLKEQTASAISAKAELARATRAAEQAQARVTSLEIDLDKSRQAVRQVETERDSLAGKLIRLEDAASNRFEGIHLGGRRVVFLVDTSGSMRDAAENEPSPAKWPAVCNTVARLIRSLPDLEQFQIVTFGTQVQYPLGGPGRWHERAAASPAAVRDALLKVEPKGGTNLYAGFEAAFRYRDQGLDAVYLFSDGLPTLGSPLPAGETAEGVPAKSQLLSRHLLTTLRTDWNKPDAQGRRVKVHAVGFFYQSADLGSFLWTLARDHGGGFVGMSQP